MSGGHGALFVGADIGSHSVKAGIFTSGGTCTARAEQPVPLRRRAGDTVEQIPEELYRATTATIAACMAQAGCKPGAVAAVALAGQMAGILGVGPDGAAVTPYDSWLDSRCRPEVEHLARTVGPELTAMTGCPPMVDHGPKMAWWHHHHPAVYRRVAKFVVPSAYVAGRLCDLPAELSYVDWTHIHFSGLADAARGAWSSELAAAVDVDMDRLPRIVAPTEVVGRLTPEAAQRCGLLAGTTVAAGLGDTAAGALGAGTVWSGQALDTAGTASVLAVSTNQFRPDPSGTLVMMRGAVPGQWIALSYLAGGDLLTWLSRLLDEPLESLVQKAGAAPAGKLLFVPHMSGRILPAEPGARGAWVGLELTHGRGDLVRSVLESVAHEYAGILRRVGTLFPGVVPTCVRVIGGGSQDRVWNLLKASALGLPYGLLDEGELSCRGTALVAAKAVGAIDDLAATAFAASSVREYVEPDAALGHLYRCGQSRYEAVVELLGRWHSEVAA